MRPPFSSGSRSFPHDSRTNKPSRNPSTFEIEGQWPPHGSASRLRFHFSRHPGVLHCRRHTSLWRALPVESGRDGRRLRPVDLRGRRPGSTWCGDPSLPIPDHGSTANGLRRTRVWPAPGHPARVQGIRRRGRIAAATAPAIQAWRRTRTVDVVPGTQNLVPWWGQLTPPKPIPEHEEPALGLRSHLMHCHGVLSRH